MMILVFKGKAKDVFEQWAWVVQKAGAITLGEFAHMKEVLKA